MLHSDQICGPYLLWGTAAFAIAYRRSGPPWPIHPGVSSFCLLMPSDGRCIYSAMRRFSNTPGECLGFLHNACKASKLGRLVSGT